MGVSRQMSVNALDSFEVQMTVIGSSLNWGREPDAVQYEGDATVCKPSFHAERKHKTLNSLCPAAPIYVSMHSDFNPYYNVRECMCSIH